MAHTRDPDPIFGENLTGNARRCFCFPSFSRRSSGVGLPLWDRVGSSRTQERNPWWSRGIQALKKIREWSEIVAGPKWKTFVRRFGRDRGSGSGNARHGKFQYDPLSYALNFDEGPGQNAYYDEQEDDNGLFRDFSSRYASVSGSSKPLYMEAASSSSGTTNNHLAVTV